MNLIEQLEAMARHAEYWRRVLDPGVAAEMDAEADREAIETVRAMQEALQEILRVHANDNNRPEAFYIAARALRPAEGNAG